MYGSLSAYLVNAFHALFVRSPSLHFLDLANSPIIQAMSDQFLYDLPFLRKSANSRINSGFAPPISSTKIVWRRLYMNHGFFIHATNANLVDLSTSHCLTAFCIPQYDIQKAESLTES